MPEHLPNNLNEDAALPVKGSLLMRMIRHIRRNRVTAGFGLLGERSAGGTTLAIDPSIIPDTQPDRVWKGIVTSSSSTSEEHTIREVDFDGNQLSLGGGGFETTNAKAYNGRKGVPVDTIVLVHEFRGETANTIDYRFSIPDGLTASPKDLVNTTTTADTDDWDVETQGSDEEGADFDPSRHALSIPAMFMYDRELTVDSSGFVTKIGAERETFLSGDTAENPKDNHITLVTATSGGATGKDIKLNEPQDQSSSITINLISSDNSVNISAAADAVAAGTNDIEGPLNFDDAGRNREGLAKAATVYTYDITATPAGVGACSSTFNVVTGSNATSTTADDCSWELLFIEPTTTGTIIGVEANNVTDAVNDQAEVTLQIDLSGVTGYSGAAKQVLVNDNGTIKWVNTAECP